MTGQLHNGLVLILIFGLGMTSSYVIDDPYSSDEEMDTVDDMTDEMTKLDEMGARNTDKEQAEDLVVRDLDPAVEKYIKDKADQLKPACKEETKSANANYKPKPKEALRKFYQVFQHGDRSISKEDDVNKALKNEACGTCVLIKLCEDNAVLTKLQISLQKDDKIKRPECIKEVFKIFEEEERGTDIKCNENARFRTADGTCNNLDSPIFGSSGSQFRRLVPNDYGDGISTLRTAKNGNLTNPRDVSRFVHGSNQDRTNPDSQKLTHITMNWGQIMDHDITLAEAQGLNCEPPALSPECINIEIPLGDEIFRGREIEFIEMERDKPHTPASTSKECLPLPREHSNAITAWVDGSNVYGSSKEEEDALRAPDGRMKIMKHPHGCPLGNLLPADLETFCPSKDPNRPCFLAGDERANENQGLMSLHTLLVREHNRIATWFGQMTQWNSERIYQETRKIIGAYNQVITYGEFLPQILSPRRINQNGLRLLRGIAYSNGYDKTINPQMSQAFYTAAYRFGHSLVQEVFSRISQDGLEHKCGRDSKKEFLEIPVLDFGNPIYLYEKCQGGVDSIFRGLLKDAAAKVDGRFSSSVQENLFRGEGDLADLVAINIRRAREHGVPGYTKYRNLDLCKNGPKVLNFNDLISKAGFDPEDVKRLKAIYDHVDDIDLFSGGMLEPDEPESVLGSTFNCIISEQFRRLKFGDRFWHENGPDAAKKTLATAFTPCQLREIRKITLSKMICNNGDDIPAVPRFAFQQSDITVPCEKLPEINLNPWRNGFKCTLGASSDSVSADHPFEDEL